MRRSSRLLFLLCSLASYLFLPAGIQAAERIVSLDMCTDWMLARYADRPQVLALSPLHRQFPVAWLDKHWPTHDGTIEQIVELRPDLIIAGQYTAQQLRARLKTLGFKVEILPLPRTLTHVTEYERHFLELIGKPATLASQPPAAAPPVEPRKRLLLLGANGIGTGRGTFEDGILERAGWANYLPGTGYLRLDLETIAIDPPDAVLWASPGNQALANRFAEHPLLQRRIAPQNWLTTDYWRWQCPGPWSWELVKQLQHWRHKKP
jgi:iron complex transport system substrate-binding protein